MVGLHHGEPPSSELARPAARPVKAAERRILRAAAAALVYLACHSVAQAQPDFAVGDPTSLSAVERIRASLASLPNAILPPDPVGAVLGWITRAAVDHPPAVLPETVMLHPIPGHGSYRYAVIGGQRLVVDAATRTVVYVVD